MKSVSSRELGERRCDPSSSRTFLKTQAPAAPEGKCCRRKMSRDVPARSRDKGEEEGDEWERARVGERGERGDERESEIERGEGGG